MLKETELLIEKGEMLPLMEEFYTIQGEGYHTGKAAYFIRVGGCDVGCHWCDVKESWNADLHPPTLTDQIVDKAKQYANTVVITGGEPLMWNMEYITRELAEANLKVHIETSGAYKLSGKYDWICLSPKKINYRFKKYINRPMSLRLLFIINMTSNLQKSRPRMWVKNVNYTYSLNGAIEKK